MRIRKSKNTAKDKEVNGQGERRCPGPTNIKVSNKLQIKQDKF